MRHAPRVGMLKPRQAVERLDHVGEPLAGRYFHAHARVFLGRIPPVMPNIRFDGRGLSLAQDAGLFPALHGQLAVENAEAFHDRGMAVFADDFGSDTREQLGHYPAIGVAVGKLENRGALTSDGVFPNLADLDRCEVGRRVGIGMRHGRTRPPFGTAGCSTGLTAAASMTPSVSKQAELQKSEKRVEFKAA